MYFETSKKISYFIFFEGEVLAGIDIWKFISRNYSSETPNSI